MSHYKNYTKEGEILKVGQKITKWTPELEKILLEEVEKGAKSVELQVKLQMSAPTIRIKLKEMGFEGLLDARRVMQG